MAPRMWAFAVITLGMALGFAQGADPTPAPRKVAKLMKTKLAAARTAFEAVWASSWSDVEVPYKWSRRWLEVERELSEKTEDRIAALRGHLKRVTEMENVAQRLFRQRLLAIDQLRAAAFYVAEAEAWLGQATEEGAEVMP